MLAASLLILAFLFVPQQKPTAACTLSGTVVNSVTGAPMTKVELQAEPSDGGLAASTTADAKGNFTMVDLPPGQYRLKGVRNGFLETYYGKGATITLEAGQELKELQIKMLPFGVIAGTVRDADGEPISGAAVTLWRESYNRSGRRTADFQDNSEVKTDDLGQYRIADLKPGKYYVLASPRNGGKDYGYHTPIDHSAKSTEPLTAMLPSLYPGVLDPASARAVQVAAGVRITGIDIALVRSVVFKVVGRATAAAGLEKPTLSLRSAPDPEGIGLYLDAEVTNREGDFEFRGVPPGSYELGATSKASDGQKQPGIISLNMYERWYIAKLPLTVNSDIGGIRVEVKAGIDLTGHITVEGDEKAKLSGSAVRFRTADGNGESALIHDDNTFAVSLDPVRYSVSLALDKSSLVTKSIRSDGIDVFQDGLTVSEGGKVALEIVLAPEGGQVDGVVVDKDEKPAAGATVVLIADGKLRARADSYHEYTTDQYGRYHFENIRPGDYKLFVWDDPEPNAWFDPEFLRSSEDKAERVTIPIKGHEVKRLHL